MNKPHLKLNKNKNLIILEIDSWELKDFIEDFLCEECDIEYEYFEELKTSFNRNGYRKYNLYFKEKFTKKRIIEALNKIKDSEIMNIVEHQRAQSNSQFFCKCCGYNTLSEYPSGTFEICEICFWEDDITQSNNPENKGGANKISLNQAKLNFEEHGASEKRFLKDVRKVLPEDIRNIK